MGIALLYLLLSCACCLVALWTRFLVVCGGFEGWIYFFSSPGSFPFGTHHGCNMKKGFEYVFGLFLGSFTLLESSWLPVFVYLPLVVGGFLLVMIFFMCKGSLDFFGLFYGCFYVVVLFCNVLISVVVVFIFSSRKEREKKKKGLSCPALIRMFSAD